jgi:hypothetical protein
MKKHSKKNFHKQNFDKAGTWENKLEPPITLSEVLTKITVTPQAPDNFLQSLVKDFPELTARVVQS